MAERYADWHRQQLDAGTTSAQQAQGRKVLGLLMEQLRLGGLPTGVLRRVDTDGTQYIASFDGTTPTVQIITVGAGTSTKPLPPVDLWIPQGFVFTPGNDVSPSGFGLPVQFDPKAPSDPFDPRNTNPGLGVGRWTAGGACGQVLLTQQDTTDYPREKVPSPRRIPIGFDAKEWMTGAYTAPAFAAWHAVRPRFNDFSWTPDVMGARRSLWNTFQASTAITIALPFAGFYDDAQMIVDLGTGYGLTPSAWPLAPYRTETGRANADGVPATYTASIPASYAEGWTNGSDVDLMDEVGSALTTGSPRIDIGVKSGLKAATVRHGDQWIGAGNIFWHPADPGLPTLSWEGYPAQNLPNWLVTGGWVGATGGPIFPLEGWHYEWRGQTRYVYGKNLYAMGRCIGVLPDTVIAAAIRVETLHHDDGTPYHVNRVVAITWNAADQYGNSSGIAYFWKFSVWCVDFLRDGTIPLHVTSPAIGAYDVTTNPTGWQLCGSFIAWPQGDPGNGVGGLPERALWQAWRFNGDGTKAIAAFGVPPYLADWGPSFAQELDFSAIAPDELGVSSGIAVAAPALGVIVAVDYDVNGQPVWVWEQTLETPEMPMPPDGVMDATFGLYYWSHGGAGEVTAWAGAGVPSIPDHWVLSARDGAMILTDHWFACQGTTVIGKYQVRAAREGSRVATFDHDDPFLSALGLYNDGSWLSDLNASYGCDRAGNWVMGYDLGVTAGASVVYDPIPTCGQPASTWTTAGCTTSGHTASRWFASFGDPQSMAQIEGEMRGYPLGVI